MAIKNNIGGKAYNLGLLKQKGFNVPEFFVLTHENIRNNQLKEIEEKIKSRIIAKEGDFILRSSATGEDNPENSFAGIFESIKIHNKENFKEDLKKVLDSLNSERLSFYLKNKKIKEKPKLSIIVQEFVTGDASGVMFSSINKNGKKGTLINSNYGGASSIVDGKDSDSYFVDENSNVLEKVKQENKFSLIDSQIKSLVELGKRIEKIFDAPQDIEWTIKDNRIYVLQSRPITKQISNEILVWDNSNIAESYSGIILPLTSSYIQYAYKITYIDLARRSGVSERKIKENQHLFENLLGFFYGRVYYNMLNWYKMLTLYPGYERNKQNLDTMISIKSKEDLDEQYKKNVSALFKTKYYSKLLVRYPFFNSEVKKFKSVVKTYLLEFNKQDLNKMNPKELSELYHRSVNELLSQWGITVESDFLLMTYFGMLEKFCKKNNLENQFIYLISDIKDVISAEQVNHLRDLSNKFNSYNPLVNLAKKNKFKDCLKEINSNSNYINLNSDLQKYLKEYGGRFANELKLETEDSDTNPGYIIKLLLLYSNIRSKNESQEELNLKLFNLSFNKRVYLKYLLKKIKFYARQREELRLLRAQSFSIARKIFLEIGKRFVDNGIMKHPEDIFYLEVNEIVDYIKGISKNKDFLRIVELRKKEYIQFESKDLEDVFYTYGYSLDSKFTKEQKKDNDFMGQGCSGGIVKGKVKIMKTFSLPDKGSYDIVVTKHTDPGWTPLFGLCEGIIVEHGGLLSHAAIISRELNLPCIIGLKNATKNLKDGQTITLNGFTGEVTIHD